MSAAARRSRTRLKLVRNATNGKSLMFAFEGGYHGRTLGRVGDHLVLPLSPPLRPFRRPRALHAVPLPLPRPQGHEQGGVRRTHCVEQFARLFESEYNGVWDPKAGQAEYAAFYVEPIQGTGGYVIPPPNYFDELKKRARRTHGILLVVDEIQMGFYRDRQALVRSSTSTSSPTSSCSARR